MNDNEDNDNINENKNNDNIIEDEDAKKDRQLDTLIDTVENHTRTERHLEQYSHIGKHENKEHARDIQEIREEQIESLKDEIKGDKQDSPSKEEQLEDLKEKYESSEGYKENNEDHMNKEDLENLEKKQENRKIQIENLEENISDEQE